MPIATLFDPSTGERVQYRFDWETSEYEWTEGNYGCDCNRRLFMARAQGRPEPDPNPCGETIVLEALVDDDGDDLVERKTGGQ